MRDCNSPIIQGLEDCIREMPEKDRALAEQIAKTCYQNGMTLEEFRSRYQELKTPETKKNKPHIVLALVFGEGILIERQEGMKYQQ